jgi:hypothetical protein
MARAFRFSLAAPVALVPWWLAAATLTVDIKGGADHMDIQSAIDAAKDGDTVLVKPGEYVIAEPIDFNRDRSLLARGARDPGNAASAEAKNPSLIGEAGERDTIIRMSDTPSDPERSSVVLFAGGESGASRLQGFTLTGGTGSKWGGDWGQQGGGGVLCMGGSSPAIRRCTISGNLAAGPGGAPQ